MGSAISRRDFGENAALIELSDNAFCAWPELSRIVQGVEIGLVNMDMRINGETRVAAVLQHRVVDLAHVDDWRVGPDRKRHQDGQAVLHASCRVDELDTSLVLALHPSQLFGRVLVILPVPVDTAVAIEARKHKVAWVFGQALGLAG